MKFVCSVLCVLAFVYSTEGKRYRRDLSERSLPEALHFMTTTDVEDIQCLFDTTPNCWKRAYINDLADDLEKIGQIFAKLKSFNWFTEKDKIPKFEEYERELGEDIKKILKLLPKSVGFNEETQQHEYLFNRVNVPCIREYLKIDFNDNSLADFEAARNKAIQHFLKCESDGYDRAKEELENICLSNANDAMKKMNLILELMSELRDLNVLVWSIMYLDSSNYSSSASEEWNTALKEDAFDPQNVKDAAKIIANPSVPGTSGNSEKRGVNIQQLVSKIENAKETSSAVRNTYLSSRKRTEDDYSFKRDNHIRGDHSFNRKNLNKADYSLKRGKQNQANVASENSARIKQRLEELLRENSRRGYF